MRILRLSLQAFGPFTDFALDLSAGNFGLHVIYGPNEAGKSSALRAMRQAFFGIPGNSADDFVHAYKNLRVGATLGVNGAQTFEFIRRKGSKNTLLQPDDKTVLDEAVLNAHLGGIDKGSFETMFGIDHASLVQGGQAIVRGEGEIGRILFAAGAGIADLRSVEKKLDEEMVALFKPGGSIPTINKAISELDRAKKAIRDAQLPSSQWQEQEKSLRHSNERLTELEQHIHETSLEKSRLQRLHEAQPAIAERNHLAAQLAALGSVPVLSDTFLEQWREAVAESNAAHTIERNALASLRDLETSTDSIASFEPLLADADAIERLREDLGSHRKAQQDLPTLIGRRQQLDSDAREILAHLRPDLPLDEAQQLRLTKKQQVEIQNLGNVHKALLHDTEQSEKQIAALTAEHAAADAQLSAIRSVPDTLPLQAAIRRAQAEGDVEQQVKQAQDELCELENKAKNGVRSLTLWTGTLEELESLPVPADETIERFESQFAEADRRTAQLAERLKEAASQEAELARQLEQFRLEQDVPTEDDLSAARHERDELWRQIWSQWRLPTSDPAATEDPPRFRDYAERVRTADELSDRLRREAERVATRANLETGRKRAQDQVELLLTERQDAEKFRKQTEDAWNAHWQPSGIVPLPPREMRAWSQRRKSLAETAEARRKQERRLTDLRTRREQALFALGSAWTNLSQPPFDLEEPLAPILERADELVERFRATAEQERQAKKDVAALRKKLDETRAHARDSNDKLIDWLTKWAAAMAHLGLPESAHPSQAVEAMTQAAELSEKLKDSRDLHERIAGIERDALRFTKCVHELAERAAPEIATLPVEQAALELLKRLKVATAEKDQHEARQAEQNRERAKLEQSRKVIGTMDARLAALCQEAACRAPEELPEAARRSAIAKELSAKLAGVDTSLLRLSGGATLAEFIGEASECEPDTLSLRISQLADQLDAWTTEKNRLHEAKGAEENALRQMDGSARAADAAEEAQGLLAQIESAAQEYARLRLASAVLREGINRYREKNQGPILARASSIFAGLTLGSFSGLNIDFNEKGDAILVGVRAANKETVHVAGMSEGTADQLYLALRLASLEAYMERNQPIPFTVDDLLVNFDDERALATLQELSQLSIRTQILFFTHHKHLVELAKAHLDPNTLFVHDLRKSRSGFRA